MEINLLGFKKKEKAMKNEKVAGIIRKYTYYTTAAGLVPIPVADLLLISGLQVKMIHDMSIEYDVPFKKNTVKSIIGALLGYIVPQSMTRTVLGSALKTIPGIGTILGVISMPIFTGGATWTLGQIFYSHFEKGGTLEDFVAEDYKEEVIEKFEEGKKVAKKVKEDVKKK